MIPEPIVSIIIPAYNAERYIEETLLSAQTQTLEEWEVVVVDDGSTDRTAEIVDEFCRRDSRFRLIRSAKQNVAAARNRAVPQARAPYMAFLDADDMWVPEKLERQLHTLLNENVDIVYCARWYCDARGAPLNHNLPFPTRGRLTGREVFVSLFSTCHFVPSCVLGRSDVFRSLGGFDEQLDSSDDWDLWLRIALNGHTFFSMQDKLCIYRVHSSNLSSNLELKYRDDGIVLERHSGHPWLPKKQRRSAHRLRFRNHFTYLGDAGKFDNLIEIFHDYARQDPSGHACRVMKLLHIILPLRIFWFLSRYLVIPLAWHLERLGEHMSLLTRTEYGEREASS